MARHGSLARLFVACAALAVAAVAHAGGSPSALLKKIDKANNPFMDRVFTMRMDIKEADGSTRILFPKKQALNLDVHLQKAGYKPGEQAVAGFNITTAQGNPVQSALGAVVFDKAVSERVRTDQDFGGRGFGFIATGSADASLLRCRNQDGRYRPSSASAPFPGTVQCRPRLSIGCRGNLLHTSVRVDDLGRPVGMNDHYSVAVQQSPALAVSEPVEQRNTRAGVRLPP